MFMPLLVPAMPPRASIFEDLKINCDATTGVRVSSGLTAHQHKISYLVPL